jgi:hypothetical protein
VKTLHPKSEETQTTDNHRDERCAPAMRVPDGAQAQDLMVVLLDGQREPFAYAAYPGDCGVLEVRLKPTGERLPDLARALRTIADKLEPLYVAFSHKRQARVDEIRVTAERMRLCLQEANLYEREREQVFKLLDPNDQDLPF